MGAIVVRTPFPCNGLVWVGNAEPLTLATSVRYFRCNGCCIHWSISQTWLESTVRLPLVIGYKDGPPVFPFPVFGMFFLDCLFQILNIFIGGGM